MTKKTRKIKVGTIGCGNISSAYFSAAKTFKNMEITKVADLNMKAAKAQAAKFGFQAVTVEQLLADPEIEIILNLTTPQAHTEVNLAALNAGKHVHCEKPFALELKDAEKVQKLAAKKGLLTGCAPDTFLGGSHQTCRKIIDDGKIGRPVAATAFLMCHGHESWHPNAGFYYLYGGGPMLDMGPYYITALVNMLGPAKRVCGSSSRAFDKRVATCEALKGKKLPVEVDTHLTGVIDFANGASATVTMSFDVWGHHHRPIEIYGTESSMSVPDPNCFGGEVQVLDTARGKWKKVRITHKYTENFRSIAVADMADAIIKKRKNRCSGELATHVLEIMLAFEKSSKTNKHVEIKNQCKQPEALPTGLREGYIR